MAERSVVVVPEGTANFVDRPQRRIRTLLGNMSPGDALYFTEAQPDTPLRYELLDQINNDPRRRFKAKVNYTHQGLKGGVAVWYSVT